MAFNIKGPASSQESAKVTQLELSIVQGFLSSKLSEPSSSVVGGVITSHSKGNARNEIVIYKRTRVKDFPNVQVTFSLRNNSEHILNTFLKAKYVFSRNTPRNRKLSATCISSVDFDGIYSASNDEVVSEIVKINLIGSGKLSVTIDTKNNKVQLRGRNGEVRENLKRALAPYLSGASAKSIINELITQYQNGVRVLDLLEVLA